MKHDDTHSRVEALFGQLVEALQTGRSDALRAYLDAAARFTQYSFNNVCLIFAQRPDATRVAGYQTWKRLGRQVRKGEHGVLIIAPIVGRRRPDREEDEERDKGRALLGYRAVHVFDIAQTEGADLPRLEQEPVGDPAGYLPALRSAVQVVGIRLEYSACLPAGTFGESRGGLIVLAEGLSPVDDLSVLAHEFAHELLHKGADRPARRTTRETEAEAVAYIVSRAIGIEARIRSADYIAAHGGEAKTLIESLERVQRTAARILQDIGFDQASDSSAAA